MNALAAETRRATAAEYYSLDDGRRWQLVAGELLEMAPAPKFVHQAVSARLHARLLAALEPRGWVVLHAPTDLELDDANVYQPDVVVYTGREPVPDDPEDWRPVGLPVLVVEVLSPSTRRLDLGVKRRAYARAGIPELWVADPADKSVRLFRAPHLAGDPVAVLGRDGRLTSPALPGFAVECGYLWA